MYNGSPTKGGRTPVLLYAFLELALVLWLNIIFSCGRMLSNVKTLEEIKCQLR